MFWTPSPASGAPCVDPPIRRVRGGALLRRLHLRKPSHRERPGSRGACPRPRGYGEVPPCAFSKSILSKLFLVPKICFLIGAQIGPKNAQGERDPSILVEPLKDRYRPAAFPGGPYGPGTPYGVGGFLGGRNARPLASKPMGGLWFVPERVHARVHCGGSVCSERLYPYGGLDGCAGCGGHGPQGSLW